MADPEKPVLDYSYTAFQAEQQSNPFPGTNLDNDLAKVKTSLDATIDGLKDIRRSDGKLKNEIVTLDALAPDVRVSLGVDPGLVEAVTAAKEDAEAAATAATGAIAPAVAAKDAAEAAAATAEAAIVDVANGVAQVSAAAAQAVTDVGALVTAAEGDVATIVAGVETVVGEVETIRDEVEGLTQYVPVLKEFVTSGAGPYDMDVDLDSVDVLDVWISGLQQPRDSYTVAGQTFTLEAPLPANGLLMEAAVRADVRVAATLPQPPIGTADITNLAVTTAKIADANVTEAKLASDAVTAGKIGAGAVTEAKIGAGAVTADKIGAGAVVEAKIGAGAVVEAKLGNLAVAEGKIANSAVTAGKIADGAVTVNKIGSGAVTTDKIGASQVTGAKIAAGTITEDKLHADVVAQLGGGATFFRGYLAGCGPERAAGTNTGLAIQRGSFARSNGASVHDLVAQIVLNVATYNGASTPNGRDSAAAPVHRSHWYPNLIRNDSNGTIAGLLSRAIVFGDMIIPTGYTYLRTLPFGLVYRTDWEFGAGFPFFHVACWPQPYVSYTGFKMAAPYIIVNSASNTAYATISTFALVPDGARLVKFMCRITGGASGGSAYISSIGTSSEILLATCAANQEQTVIVDLRVGSTETGQEFEYKISGSARLTMGVMGYYWTQRS